jgi:hypothetical protein
MPLRIFTALALLELAMGTACDDKDPCIRIGTDLAENDRDIAKHAEDLHLSMLPHESAVIAGAAYASSQIEGGQSGVPVLICLRQGERKTTEFRVLSTSGKVLLEWRSVAEFLRR